jgi:hypothetical protein
MQQQQHEKHKQAIKMYLQVTDNKLNTQYNSEI